MSLLSCIGRSELVPTDSKKKPPFSQQRSLPAIPTQMPHTRFSDQPVHSRDIRQSEYNAKQKPTKWKQIRNLFTGKKPTCPTQPITMLEARGINLDDIVSNSASDINTKINISRQDGQTTYIITNPEVQATFILPEKDCADGITPTQIIQNMWNHPGNSENELITHPGNEFKIVIKDATKSVTITIKAGAAEIYGTAPSSRQVPPRFDGLNSHNGGTRSNDSHAYEEIMRPSSYEGSSDGDYVEPQTTSTPYDAAVTSSNTSLNSNYQDCAMRTNLLDDARYEDAVDTAATPPIPQPRQRQYRRPAYENYALPKNSNEPTNTACLPSTPQPKPRLPRKNNSAPPLGTIVPPPTLPRPPIKPKPKPKPPTKPQSPEITTA